MEKAFENATPGMAKASAIQELNAAKAELAEAKEELAQVESQTTKTTQASQRLTSQYRQMKDELTKMIQAGQQDSKEYSELQQKAASLERQLKVTNVQMKVLSSPNAKFEGVISGVTGMTGALTAGMGIMGLFNSKNEELNKIQEKLQAVMAITIGVEQVANALRSTSAFKLTILTKVHDFFTAANYRLATALGISNAAAQTLTATLTLGLSVAVGFLISLWNKYSEEQAQTAVSTKDSQKAMSDAIDESSKTMAEQMIKLDDLKSRWAKLGSNLSDKKKFIDENRDAFHSLGLEVDNINGVENVLVSKTGAVVKALQLRAEATAYSKVAEQYYEKRVKEEMQADTEPMRKMDFKKKIISQNYSPKYKSALTSFEYYDMNDVKTAREKHKKSVEEMRKKFRKNDNHAGDKLIEMATGLNSQADSVIKGSFRKKSGVSLYTGTDTDKSEKAAAKKAAREREKEKKRREEKRTAS